MKNINTRFKYILIIFLLILSLSFAISAEQLKVHFIDVGQGDSILIQTPQDKNMLIDGGDRWNRVEEKLLSYLTE